MKVLMLNGSPRKEGNVTLALREMEKIFVSEGIEVETVRIGGDAIPGCIACDGCRKTGRCVFDDAVNEIADKLRDADGFVVGSPVYYASANATVVACLDRLFCSTHFDKTMKVGAALAAARRGGITATVDELNKYFLYSGMPVVSGQYWNGLHGSAPGEGAEDAEGLQMMRTLARNMVFLMRSIASGIEQFGLPEKETIIRTNFIR